MPNSACPGAARAANASRARSAQRSDSSMARSASLLLRRQLDAFVELHLDVGAEQALDVDARSGVSMCRDPSMCDWKRTPSSLISRILESDITWKPPRVGEDRAVPAHEGVQAAEAGDALGAGAQHQVVGVGEDDVGAGGLHLVEVQRLDGGGGADRHEGGRADPAMRRHHLAAARRAVLRQQLKSKRRHVFLHRHCQLTPHCHPGSRSVIDAKAIRDPGERDRRRRNSQGPAETSPGPARARRRLARPG